MARTDRQSLNLQDQRVALAWFERSTWRVTVAQLFSQQRMRLNKQLKWKTLICASGEGDNNLFVFYPFSVLGCHLSCNNIWTYPSYPSPPLPPEIRTYCELQIPSRKKFSPLHRELFNQKKKGDARLSLFIPGTCSHYYQENYFGISNPMWFFTLNGDPPGTLLRVFLKEAFMINARNALRILRNTDELPFPLR